MADNNTIVTFVNGQISSFEVNGELTQEIRQNWESQSGSQVQVIEVGTDIIRIEQNAFINCNELISIILCNNIEAIGPGAFANCTKLIDITIPENTYNIGSNSFNGCSSLKSITFSNIVYIENYAFAGCSQLSAVYISDISKWCQNTFSSNESNPLYYAHNLYVNNELISNLTIPNTVTHINSKTFINCENLINVVIPNNVQQIANYSFNGCNNIKRFLCEGFTTTDARNTYNEIGIDQNYIFGDRSTIVTFTNNDISSFEVNDELTQEIRQNWESQSGSQVQAVEVGTNVTGIWGGAFLDCSSLTSITIPNSVTSIKDQAFYGCRNLSNITIPDSVTVIGNSAFSGCSSLTSIAIPDSVTNIRSWAFSRCSSLSSITIPNSVSSIGTMAFERCSSLSSITIPDGVTSIEDQAFNGCSNLSSITIPNSVASIGLYAFSGCPNATALFLNRTYEDVLTLANYSWGLNASQINASEFMLQNIGLSTILDNSTFYSNIYVGDVLSDAFNSCSNLTSIQILSANSIEDQTFASCVNVYEMALPGVSVLDNVFGFDRGILNIQSLSICDGMLDIGTNLSGLSNLNTLNLPSTLSILQYGALSNDPIYELDVPSNTSLCIGCFVGLLSSLQSLSISLNSVPQHDDGNGNVVLSGDLGLSSLDFENDNVLDIYCGQPSIEVEIGEFINSTNVQKLIFENSGENIKAIQENAFANCRNLVEIDLLSSTVETVQSNTFLNCENLTTINFPSTLTSLHENAFAGCGNLNANGLSIPETVNDIYGYIGVNTFNNVPDQLRYIGPSVFYDATFNVDGIPNINLSNVTIKEYAFANNCQLYSIAINEIENIPEHCFENNNIIENVEIKHDESPLTIEKQAFYNCIGLINCHISSETQPTYIKQEAFANTNSLTSIDLCNVVEIGPSAFYGSGLQNDGLDDSNDVVLPNTVLSIGQNAFGKCQMAQIYMNDKFGDEQGNKGEICCEHPLFNGCESLNYICLLSTSYDAFRATCSSESYSFPEITSFYDKYQVSAAWKSVKNWFFANDEETEPRDDIIIEFYDIKLRYTGEITGYNCLSLDNTNTILLSVIPEMGDFVRFIENPILPVNINRIQEHAFDSALSYESLSTISLQDVYFPGLSTFANSEYMISVDANNALSLTDFMFYNATKLSTIDANKARYIGKNAFDGCIDLISIDFPNAQIISNNAFSRCISLSSVSIPNTYSIGENAFFGCNSLIDLTCNSIKNINSQAFYGCNNIQSFDQAYSAKYIGPSAFMDCSSLSSIDIRRVNQLNADILNGTSIESLSVTRWTLSIDDYSLRGMPSIAKTYFIDRYPCDINDQFTSFYSNNCKATNGQKFYTLINNYKHPSFIAVSPTKILSAINTAFECERFNDDQLTLLSVDDEYLMQNSNVSIDGTIGCISGFSSNKVNAIFFNGNSGILTQYENYIAQNIFNQENNPYLTFIYALDVNYREHEEQLSGFWAYVSDSNTQLTVVFEDGDVVDGEFTSNDDPFIKKKIGDEFVIYGIADKRVHQPNQTILKGNTISSFAFRSNSYAQELSNIITDLSVAEEANLSSILSNAFSLNTTLTCISNLGNNLKLIDPTAFEQCGLQKITLPSSLLGNDGDGISGYGLNHTITLSSLTYSNGIKAIAPSAMIDCQSLLADISFPSTLTAIHDHAFAETYDVFPRITNLNLSTLNKLSTIDEYAFYNSISSLDQNTLVLPSSLTSIGAAAFAYRRDAYTQILSSLLQVNDALLNDNLEQIGPSAFMFNHFKKIEFGNKLSLIDDYAFACPKYKQNIYILSNILSIGYNAFQKNVILNPENIKANIISVDVATNRLSSIFGIEEISLDYSAPNRPGLTDGTVVSATLDGNDPGVSFAFIDGGYMHFCPSNISIDLLAKTLIRAKTSADEIYVPSYLTAIGPSALIDCIELTSLSAVSPISIGEYAFQNCSALQKIYPTNISSDTYLISSVEEHAFYNCQNLTNVELLSTATYIKEAAFYNCLSIQSFYSEDNLSNLQYYDLSSIGTSAFYNCKSLTSFSIGPKILQIDQAPFDNCDNISSINIYLDHQAFLEVAQRQDWISNNSTISDVIIAIFGGVREDGQCLIKFTDISYTNNGIVKIDNEFADIYEYGENLSAVSSVNDSFRESKQRFLNLSGVTRVDDFAFYNEIDIDSISFLPNSITNVGLSAIGDYAFYGCKSLMSFNSGEISSKTIGCYAFADCNNMLAIAIDLPYLESIGQGAFYGTSLNTLYVVNCLQDADYITQAKEDFQQKIGYDPRSNPNPLELPEYCNIVFINSFAGEIGRFDYLFNDLTHATIDTNRNSMVFVDKMRDSVRPLLLVKQANSVYLPAIVENSFHANIVGKWK